MIAGSDWMGYFCIVYASFVDWSAVDIIFLDVLLAFLRLELTCG